MAKLAGKFDSATVHGGDVDGLGLVPGLKFGEGAGRTKGKGILPRCSALVYSCRTRPPGLVP